MLESSVAEAEIIIISYTYTSLIGTSQGQGLDVATQLLSIATNLCILESKPSFAYLSHHLTLNLG